MKNRITLIATSLCVVLLIVDPATAGNGARDGIALCTQSIIPSLFPFIFLTTVISGHCDIMRIPILRSISKWTGVPEGCESIVLLGWLGGYPVGAKCVYDNYKSGHLNKETAARMLGFCNNAGPSFIFGVLFHVFQRPAVLWILWLIQITSSLLTGIILPGKTNPLSSTPTNRRTNLTQSLTNSVQAMATICGWIILFRVGFAYLNLWFLSDAHPIIGTLVTGLLELTNGCIALTAIENEAIRFIVCNFMLTIGGFCVALQTKSVVKELGFSRYLQGKLLQCCISIILSLICV